LSCSRAQYQMHLCTCTRHASRWKLWAALLCCCLVDNIRIVTVPGSYQHEPYLHLQSIDHVACYPMLCCAMQPSDLAAHDANLTMRVTWEGRNRQQPARGNTLCCIPRRHKQRSHLVTTTVLFHTLPNHLNSTSSRSHATAAAEGQPWIQHHCRQGRHGLPSTPCCQQIRQCKNKLVPTLALSRCPKAPSPAPMIQHRQLWSDSTLHAPEARSHGITHIYTKHTGHPAHLPTALLFGQQATQEHASR
jgi:hypothetical protein